MSKLDQIRALGAREMARRFGAPTLRKPVPEIAGVNKGVHVIQDNVDTNNVDSPRKRGRPAKADSARSDEAAVRRAGRVAFVTRLWKGIGLRADQGTRAEPTRPARTSQRVRT